MKLDVPFYAHEVDAYWNDIGNLEELRQGNFDALSGQVALDPGVPEVAEGVRAGEGTDVTGAELTPPLLFGPGVQIGEDVRITGPAVVGDGCRIGDGARVAGSILLAGTELAPGAVLAGGIVARHGG
jgi:NDP-sugar pyrophosphorylase family protein